MVLERCDGRCRPRASRPAPVAARRLSVPLSARHPALAAATRVGFRHTVIRLPDYWLSRPADDPAPDVRGCLRRGLATRALGAGDSPSVDEVLPAPKWQFLCYLAEAHNLVLHGSGDPNISIFEPRQADDLSAFGAQRAVYAAADGIWAMFPRRRRPQPHPVGDQRLRPAGRRTRAGRPAPLRVLRQPIRPPPTPMADRDRVRSSRRYVHAPAAAPIRRV